MDIKITENQCYCDKYVTIARGAQIPLRGKRPVAQRELPTSFPAPHSTHTPKRSNPEGRLNEFPSQQGEQGFLFHTKNPRTHMYN